MERHSDTAWSLGEVRFDLLDEGRFRLDGGAMFRVVPRVLWERSCPPDERNRVRLAMRPLLVRSGEAVVLVDCGIGPERRDAKFSDQVAIEAGPGCVAQLTELGLSPGDVTHVVLTHMHFDHGGGLIEADGSPRFPNARIVVQAQEVEDSGENCPLCRASYVATDYDPVRDQFEKVDGDRELVPGVFLERTGGHTRAHQIVRVEAGGKTVVFWGDLIPTSAHLKPHYVMAFDLYPRESWEAKRRLVPRAVDEGWIQVFYHDPEQPLGTVTPEGRGFRVEPL